MLAKKIVKNVVYNSSATLIANFTGLILTIYLARVLKPSLFGIYSLSISIAFLLMTFTDLGISPTTVRYISEAYGKKDLELVRGYIRYLGKVKFALSFIVSIILLISSKFLAVNVFHKPLLFKPLAIISFFVFFFSISGFVNSIFNGLNDFKANFLRSVSFHIPRLILVVLLVSIGFGVVGAIEGYVISAVLSLAIITKILFSKYGEVVRGKTKRINKKRILRFACYLSIGSITWVVFTYIDTVMIGMFLPSKDVGFYRAAYNIVGAVSAIVSFPCVLFPVFVQLEGRDLNRAFNRVFKYSAILSIPLVFWIIVLSGKLIKFVYGIEYIQATPVLVILSILILRSSLGYWGAIFNAKEKPEYPVYITTTAMFINIVLNYILIIKIGIVGAAIATAVSNAFGWISLSIICKKMFDIFFNIRTLTKILLSGIISILPIKLFVLTNLVSGLAFISVSALIYLILIIVTGVLSKEDLEYLKQIM